MQRIYRWQSKCHYSVEIRNNDIYFGKQVEVDIEEIHGCYFHVRFKYIQDEEVNLFKQNHLNDAC